MLVFLTKKTPMLGLTILALLSTTSVSAQSAPGREVFPVPTESEVIYTFGNASKNQLPPKKLKFLVWNLHKGTEDAFKAEYLSLSFDRDIVVNQEVLLDSNMKKVFSYFPFFFHTNATSFYSGKEKLRTGVSTISAVNPSFTGYVRTQTLEPVVSSPKVTLITRYPIRFSTKQLTVVNIHGINFVSNKNFRTEIARIYEAIRSYPAPMVFTGDFNTWNEERLDILNEYAKKLGLVSAEFYPDNRMTFNGNPLDHFLHSKDMKVTNAKVEGIYQGSDHKPLEVEVELL